jgi:hypothetical protein
MDASHQQSLSPDAISHFKFSHFGEAQICIAGSELFAPERFPFEVVNPSRYRRSTPKSGAPESAQSQ